VIPTELLLAAYASGWFPMADERGAVAWYSPDPRAIIPLDMFHVPSRLQRIARQRVFRIEIDTAFAQVIRACAAADRGRDGPGTWIGDEIVESYCALHEAGYAHSVEAWAGSRLVGGLYGVALGGAFFGESMFHLAPNASKVALVALVDRLRARGFTLLDTQWMTDHLRQFGTIEIARKEYLRRLEASVRVAATFV
jgi:leucyl/phenylalanyl-tRNA---protein transferase